MLRHVEKLPNYGPEAEKWDKPLVLFESRFIVSFCRPSSQETFGCEHAIPLDKLEATATLRPFGLVESILLLEKCGKRISEVMHEMNKSLTFVLLALLASL